MNLIRKDTLREIKKTFSKYISILLIVGLGVFVFIGLISSGPIMRNTANTHVQKYNFEDILVSIPMGFEAEDFEIVESQKNLYELEYGYDIDLGIEDTTLLIKVMNMPYKINMPIIKEGRAPENLGEIMLDISLKEREYNLGDTIVFKKEVDKFALEDDESEDVLEDYTYKIVGFCSSLNYISDEGRGYSERGLGEIKGFGFVSPFEFKSEPTYARLIYKDTFDLKTTSKKYREKLEGYRRSLDLDFKYRPDNRFITLKDDIGDEIKEGEDKITDAKTKLSDAEKELSDARQELGEGQREYREGQDEFDTQTKDAKSKLDEAKEKLYKSEKDIDKGQKELDEGYEDLKDGRKKLDDAKSELSTGKIAYTQGKMEYESGLSMLESSKTQIEEAEKQLSDGRKKLDEGWDKIKESTEQLNSGKKEIEENKKILEDGEKQINEAVSEIGSALGLSTSNIDEVSSAVNSMVNSLSSAKPLIDGHGEILAGINLAEETLRDLESKKATIEDQINELELALNMPGLSQEEKDQILEQILQLEVMLGQVEEGIRQGRETLIALKSKKELIESSLNEINSLLPPDVDISKDYDLIMGQLQSAKEGIDEIKSKQKELEEGKLKLELAEEQLAEGEKQLQEGIEEAEDGEKEYSESKEKLESGKREYEEGKRELEDGSRELADSKSKLLDGQREYEDGEKSYIEGYEEFLEGRAELDAGKMAFTEGRKSYNEGLEQYEEEVKKGEEKLKDARDKLYKGENDLVKGEREFNKEKIKADEKIADGEEKISEARRILNILKRPRYVITPRYNNADLNSYLNDARSMDLLSLIFPVFFFMIALLVSFTTMTRMVEEQRTVIGTYKALGYSNSDISKKFSFYGASASIIGGVIGALLGSYYLPDIIGTAYSTGTIFEGNLAYEYYPFKILLSICIGYIFTALAAKMAVRVSLKENAANLLRVKPPKSGNRIFLERITPLWSRMNFFFKVTARNLFRYKNRMIMTIIGVMGCMALLVLGFGLRSSISGIEEIQFGEILKYNISVTYDREIDEDSYMEYRDYLKSKDLNYISVYEESFEVENKDLNQNIMLIVPNENKDLYDYVTVRNRKTKEKIELPNSGVIISEKFSKLKKLKTGDTFKFKDSEDKEHEVEVRGISEMYIGHYMYMDKEYYEKVFGRKYEINTDLLKLEDYSSEEIDNLSSGFISHKAVVSVVDIASIRVLVNKLMNSISKVELIITVASSLLAMVVLYNLTNINIEERKREISTIKVLGFYSKETTEYIYRETWILTIIGILLGIFVGKLLHYSVLQMVVPYESMMDPKLNWTSYVIAASITVLVSLVIMFIFHNKLKKIDMVESLKSNE
ncbi:FtsX-like permease family protein [Anaerosphaera multitolerans]|uniref:ABC transporter permease n=1 Tax=Anaerosphaera multitolerans TaxID=2487351 RepID=A0A437S6S3_9FIRM|nr:FtsX-like permease family protein [Anaerosphaera multitolerans]RVU54725.1 ABC transporter permease [Anaerosphaera multitolerans]